jgi:hypothetical protein
MLGSFIRTFEYDFVVDLELELKAQVCQDFITMELDHRGYNYVRSAALYRGVDCRS